MWSLKSGKTKLLWNSKEISHLVRAKTNPRLAAQSGKVELRWQSETGVKLAVIAHSQKQPGCPQYDCLINDVSFFALPKESEVGSNVPQEAPESSLDTSGRDVSNHNFSFSSEQAGSGEGNPAEMHQSHHRLVAAGFTYQYDMEDELRSELYTPTLDILRDEVAAAVPETEDMMSRAILNAFSEDHDSDASHSQSSESEQSERYGLDPPELETEVLGDVFEWCQWSEKFVPAGEVHNRKLEFMQNHVEEMVAHVRHERISPHDATRIMLRVAIILKLDVSQQPEKDTVALLGLPVDVTAQELLDCMHPFGEVDVVEISKKHKGFGKWDTVSHCCLRHQLTDST